MEVFLLLNILLVFIMKTKSETFSTKLYYEVACNRPHVNIIMSPSSARSCLGLVYMGAEGRTATELQSVLQLKGNNKDQVGFEYRRYMNKIRDGLIQMRTASRVYLSVNYTIDDDYKQRTWKYFRSEAQSVNFNDTLQTAKNINAWVETQTNHKITDLVSPISLINATAVLVNAIYFKAMWRTPFEKSTKKKFHVSAAKSVLVDMMSLTVKVNYTDLPDMDANAIELPYAKTDIRMLVILPNNTEGLPILEKMLQNFDLTTIKFKPKHFTVALPKFKVTFEDLLEEYLKNLGLNLIFKDGDLSGIDRDRKRILIESIKQKAFIEVDLKGAKAAAATSARASKGGPVEGFFIANHPFFFAIMDDEHIYFAGHIANFRE